MCRTAAARRTMMAARGQASTARCLGRSAWAAAAAWTISTQLGRQGDMTVRRAALGRKWFGCNEQRLLQNDALAAGQPGAGGSCRSRS